MTPDERPDSGSDAPHARRLPEDAPPLDTASLAHISFPPGFRARRGLNWAAIGLLYTSYYMCRYNRPIADEAIRHEFGFTKGQIGLMITANLLAYAIGQVINGLLTDRIGGKRAMLIGAAGTVVMNTLFGFESFVGHLSMFVTLWGINGFVQSYGAPGMVKMNAAWFARHERGTFAGIFGFMINLGRFLINKLGPALLAGFTIVGLVHVPALHWRWLFWVPAAICALVAVFMALAVAETPEKAGYDYTGSRDSHNDAGSTANLGLVFTTILSNPGVWVTAGAYACTGAVRQSVDQWFPSYMQEQFSVPLNSSRFQLLGFLIPLVASCGSLLSGIISDTLFQSRRAPVAALTYVIETVIIVSATQFHGVAASIVFLILISFTANSTHSLLGTAAAMDIGGRKMTGFASGLIDSFQYIGTSIIAGYALGKVVDIWGWGLYFWFMAPFGVLGAVLMFTLGHKITASQTRAADAARAGHARHRG
jgi:MFS transporter, OPA family, glycerol-3-phosphate transporter